MIGPIISKLGCDLTCGRIKQANFTQGVLADKVAAILGYFQKTSILMIIYRWY